jgi:hypothetical protein
VIAEHDDSGPRYDLMMRPGVFPHSTDARVQPPQHPVANTDNEHPPRKDTQMVTSIPESR